MPGQAAARLFDPIAHTNARKRFWAKVAGGIIGGLVVGALAVGAAALIIGTGGLATPLVAVAGATILTTGGLVSAAGGAVGAIVGERIADAVVPVELTVTGKILTASTNVWVNTRATGAARATPDAPIDAVLCKDHPGKQPNLIAEGSERVFVNQAVFSRKGDFVECGAQISEGSPNVFVGDPKARVRDVEDEVPLLDRILGTVIGLAFIGRSLACIFKAPGKLISKLPCLGAMGMSIGIGTVATSWFGSPVHAPTGSKILNGDDDNDFELAGPLPLKWSRFYNSRDTRNSGFFGQGWTNEFLVELKLHYSDTNEAFATYFDEQGRDLRWENVAPGEAQYNLAEGYSLMRAQDGQYVVSSIDGIYRLFRPALNAARTGLAGADFVPQNLKLARIEDRNGNFIELRYDEAERLRELTDTTGRLLQFDYADTPSGSGARVAQIRIQQGAKNAGDPADYSADEMPAILVQYRYDASGQLVEVVNRLGHVARRFDYTDRLMTYHCLPSGLQCFYEWKRFEDAPRVVKHWTSDGEQFDVTYEWGTDKDGKRLGRTSTRDQLGRVQRWTWNIDYNVVAYTAPHAEGDAPRTTLQSFNELRQRLTHTDPLGRTTTYRYDGMGLPAGETDSLGRSTTTLWHGHLGVIDAEIAADGSTLRYTYNNECNVTSETDSYGNVTEYGYNERGLPIVITDAKGGVKRLQWNARAQLIAYTDCSNQTTRYSYDSSGFLQTITDAAGYATRLTHDAMGRLLAMTQPDGASQTYQYDAAGRLVGATDPLSRSTRFALNARGQLSYRTDAADRGVALNYDKAFRLEALVNENGERYEFSYDAADRLVEERRIGGTRVAIDYDANDQPIAVTMHPGIGDGIDGAESKGEASIRTELIRDAVGRLTEKRTPSQHYHYQYDVMDRLIAATKLEVIAKTDNTATKASEFDLKPLHKTEFKYNKLGDLIEETASDLLTGETHTLTHAHDALGNRTQTVLPNLKSLEGTQRALNYLHYGSGHLHQINLSHTRLDAKDADGNAEGNADTIHQLIADIERDSLHREILRTQGNVTTRFALDPLGRKQGAWTQHSGLRTQPFSASDPQWQSTLHAATAPSGKADRLSGLMKGYAYDLTGELRGVAHSLNGKTQHRYDPTGRIEESLRAIKQSGVAQGATSAAIAATTDANRSEHFAYDPAGNLLDTVAAKAGHQNQQRGYVRDNLVRVFEDKRYAYDGHGRLIQKLSGKHTKQIFKWDDEHRLVEVITTRRPNTPEATTQTTKFDYDALGRRIAKHDSFGSTRFIWEGMRLIEERRGSNVVTYVYEPDSYVPLARIDAKGHETEQGGLGTTADLQAPAADHANPLTPLVVSPSNHERLNTAANDDPANWEALRSQSNRDAKQSANVQIANVYYFHTDQVGLPEELSDSEGNIRWRASYKTWGATVSETWEVTALNGESLNGYAQAQQLSTSARTHARLDRQADVLEQNLRFQGQYLDRDTGLHYNTFRFYDPDIGRFISPDPIGLEGGQNLHVYSPSPLAWIDPLGLYNGEGTRPLGVYDKHFEAKLPKSMYKKTDATHFERGNRDLYRAMQKDPVMRASIEGKYPGTWKYVQPKADGTHRVKSPNGTTWHHGNKPGSLQLVDRADHKKFHKVYHPDGKGGRNKWGGGTGCR